MKTHLLLAILAFSVSLFAQKNTQHLNLDGQVGIEGYDQVS